MYDFEDEDSCAGIFSKDENIPSRAYSRRTTPRHEFAGSRDSHSLSSELLGITARLNNQENLSLKDFLSLAEQLDLEISPFKFYASSHEARRNPVVIAFEDSDNEEFMGGDLLLRTQHERIRLFGQETAEDFCFQSRFTMRDF